MTSHVRSIRMSSGESDIIENVICNMKAECLALCCDFEWICSLYYYLKDKFGNDYYIILNPVAIVVTQRRSAWVE
jgi:hypothetical protein